MKYILTVCLFLIFTQSGYSQFDSVLVSHSYSYSEANSEPYGLKHRQETHYDSVGNRISGLSESWNGYKFIPNDRYFLSYNVAGIETNSLYQRFSNNQWQNSYRSTAYYNSSNQPDSVFLEQWTNNAWAVSSSKYYLYSISFHLIYSEQNNIRTYNYPDAFDNDTLIISQDFNTGTWMDKGKIFNSYNGSGKVDYSLVYRKDSSNWILSDSLLYFYYPNDSLFLKKQYSITDTSTNISTVDSVVYLSDTVFVYKTKYNSGSVSEERTVNYSGTNPYNFYHSDLEYLVGLTWFRTDYSWSMYDSLTNIATSEYLSTGSLSNAINHFDNHGHSTTSSYSGRTHSGDHSYGDSYYYYYLTHGANAICPGNYDSLWIDNGMNSYSWSNGGTNRRRYISSQGKYYCNLVNQYGHAFQSEPHYVLNTLSPTAEKSIDSSMFSCLSATIKLSSPDIPIYTYQWYRNDTALQNGTNSDLQITVNGLNPAIEGNYYLVVSNECGVDTSSKNFINFSQAWVRTTPSVTTFYCPGDTVVMLADSGFASYLWTFGDTTRFAKSYFGHINNQVRAIDSIGCVSYSGILLYPLINTQQLPPRISQYNDSTLRSGFSIGTIQWFLNGDTIPGATSTQIKINQAGYYKFKYSSSGCIIESEEDFFKFSEPRVVFSQDTLAVCAGVDRNLISTYNMYGGVPPFQYSWSPSTGLSGSTLRNPIVNLTNDLSYILTVTDDVGAIYMDTLYIKVKSPVQINLTGSRDSICFNLYGNNIYDTLKVTNVGSGSYSWYKDGGHYNGIGTSTAKYTYQLGTYWVVHYDGCVNYSDTIIVGRHQPIPIPVIRLESTPNNWCQTDSITLIADIVNPDAYAFKWKDGTTNEFLNSINDTVTGYTGGSYYLFITDSTGCNEMGSFNTENHYPDSIVPFALNLSGIIPTCYGDTQFLISTLYPGWNYQWFNYDIDLMNSTNEHSTSYSGNYKVFVNNGFGCHAEDSVALSFGRYIANASLSYNGVQLHVSSNTIVSSWKWELNDTTIAGEFLDHYHPQAPGWYKATPVNSSGCEASSDSIFISCALNVSLIQPSCYQTCDANISLTPMGADPFSLLWDSGDTSSQHMNVCEGIYFVQMTDHNGCLAADSIMVKSPNLIGRLTYARSPSCFQNCDASITVTGTGGVPPYIYTWNTGASGPLLDSICGGVYNLNIVDSNGCVQNGNIMISDPLPLISSITVQNASCVSCNDGMLQSTFYGGTIPYSILWSTGDTINNISNLSPGDYTLCIKDRNLCIHCDTAHVGFNVSVKNLSEKNFTIFPNPVNEILYINISGINFKVDVKISITNQIGQNVYEKVYSQKEVSIPTANFDEGIYYLQIQDVQGNDLLRAKVVLIH